MRLTRQCAGCKESFRKEELVQYFSSTGKTSAWYCHDCLLEKQAREKFFLKVCQIFCLKAPGPRIWTERKRLRDKYGYTDDTIVDCLDYIYNVQKKDKLTESLALVNPTSVAAMKKWKSQKKALGGSLIAAASQSQVQEKVIDIPEDINQKRVVRLDDGLFDD